MKNNLSLSEKEEKYVVRKISDTKELDSSTLDSSTLDSSSAKKVKKKSKHHYYHPKISKQSVTRDILILTFAALLMSTGIHYFLVPAGVLSASSSGLSQGISYTIWNAWGVNVFGQANFQQFNNVVYWSIYVVINIPIFIWSWNKFDKKFAFGSLYVVIMAAAIGFFYTFVPGFDSISLIPGYNPFNLAASFPALGPMSKQALIFCISVLSGILAAILYGSGVGLSWKAGYSSMGFDPFSKYLSNEKNIDSGKTLMLFSFISSTIWIFTNAAILGQITSWTSFLQIFISPYFIGMLIFLFIYSRIVQFRFKGKMKLSISVITKNKDEFIEGIQNQSWFRNYTSYSNDNVDHRETVVLYINHQEEREVLEYIKNNDPSAFVVIGSIRHIYGNFDKRPKV